MQSSGASLVCDHCLLLVQERDAVFEAGPLGKKVFCCTACRAIHRMIREEGLQDFYRTRDWGSAGIPEPLRDQRSAIQQDVADAEERLRPFIRGEGMVKEAEVLIDGIRCASCVWLNEKVLERTTGVLAARVNFATHGAFVRWDSARTSLSLILGRLRSIGYLARPYTPAVREAAFREQDRDLLVRFGTAAFFSMQLMLISFGLYAGFFQGIDPASKRWLAFLSFLLTTPVLFYSGYPFLSGAFRGLHNRTLNMDVLISLGAVSSYLLSIRNVLSGGEVYFDTSAMIITLILLGRFLENSAKRKASSAVSRLMALQPQEARVVRAGERIMLSVSSVVRGDRVEVRPGEKVPLDGIVIEGRSEIDESLVTGESLPVEKTIGSTVFGGSLNGLGSLVIEVTGVGRETMLARIARLVESAQAATAPIQRVADRVSAWFIPLVLIAAAGTWWHWSGRTGAGEPILNAVAVLVIACPCALGLATPVAILAGTSCASRKGILIKGGEALERLRSINAMMLDKTGTVTTGKMEVTEIRNAEFGMREEKIDLLQYAASVEQRSEHLVGAAIVRYAKEKRTDLLDVKNFEAKPGRGVQALVQGSLIRVGTRRFLEEAGMLVDAGIISEAGALETDGKAVVWIAKDNTLLGFISVKDEPKPDAVQTTERLRELGIDVTMITGDNQNTAESVGKAVGVRNVIAGVLPAGKVEEVQRLRRAGKVVAMVGDGINDAPALAAADVGMAMASGTDIAAESSSVVLMRPDLSCVVQAIDISQRTFRIIRQNLFWAFAYNIAAIPLAMAGILSPIVAAAAMAASSVTVVLNSLRLR